MRWKAARTMLGRPYVSAALAMVQRALHARLLLGSEQVNGALAAIGYADHFPVKDVINAGGSVEEVLKAPSGPGAAPTRLHQKYDGEQDPPIAHRDLREPN